MHIDNPTQLLMWRAIFDVLYILVIVVQFHEVTIFSKVAYKT